MGHVRSKIATLAMNFQHLATLVARWIRRRKMHDAYMCSTLRGKTSMKKK